MNIVFPPLTKEGDETESIFGVVLLNKHHEYVRLHRILSNGKISSSIQFLEAVENGNSQSRFHGDVIREFTQSTDLPNGNWSFTFHHGLMLVSHDEKELWCSYLSDHMNVLVGVIWDQRQGTLMCRNMQLEVIPHS